MNKKPQSLALKISSPVESPKMEPQTTEARRKGLESTAVRCMTMQTSSESLTSGKSK